MWQAAYAQAAQLAEARPCGAAATPGPEQHTVAGHTAAAAGQAGDWDSLGPLRQGLPPLAVGKLQGSCCKAPSLAAAGGAAEAPEARTPGTCCTRVSSARSSHSLCEWREECWQAEVEDGWADAVEEVA